MKSIKPDSHNFQKWKIAFREKAHLLIKIGYTRGCHNLKSDEHEEQDITEFIVNAVNDWMRSPASLPWCKYFDVHEESPVQKENCHGKSRPRTDILIKLCSRRERPEYIFEAKRLRERGYGVGKYIGPEGMGCFTEGVYASEYDEAAMLGYVQSNTLSHWKERLKKSITQKKASLYLNSFQYDEVVIAEFPLEWVSEHDRKRDINRSIRIYHILLNCSPSDQSHS
ncbi:MAG: hypothetical protein JO125_16190 [Chloroflexi bacterium]|nr:hypothetical protein [Ktedonobacteraceae bacterium]MBV8821311.1 hypothetical protein [Ktedonobacteraceae bacterium]MBV9022162.1 hypothetical protein [Ktedonobacteraceae bacterium]MBV9708935.1 hypothetical protein [Chloroflexota bacterium]